MEGVVKKTRPQKRLSSPVTGTRRSPGEDKWVSSLMRYRFPSHAHGAEFGILLFTLFHIAVTFGPMNPIAVIAPITNRPQTKPHSRVSVPLSSDRNALNDFIATLPF